MDSIAREHVKEHSGLPLDNQVGRMHKAVRWIGFLTVCCCWPSSRVYLQGNGPATVGVVCAALNAYKLPGNLFSGVSGEEGDPGSSEEGSNQSIRS